MKVRLRICENCQNNTTTEWDDENSRLSCPICNKITTHYFTDAVFNIKTQKQIQKEIDQFYKRGE